MEAGSTEFFYSRLPSNRIPLSDLFTEEHLFYTVPSNWHVIITDIRNSTIAVQSQLHETVNLIATGSIVAVLNVAHKFNISVPFFFGGDGATFIVPDLVLPEAMNALILHQESTRKNFELELRVGMVTVKQIYESGHDLKIAKYQSSVIFAIPILLGDGLAYAERLIKGDDYKFDSDLEQGGELDLEGMQCRWDKIEPPKTGQEVVSLLVLANSGFRQALVFRKVVLLLDEVYGAPDVRQPISVSKLQLRTTFSKLGMEVRARLGRINLIDQFKTWFTSMVGYLYFRTKKGKTYLNKLVEMSDTLVVDGKVNTVITGTAEQRSKLQAALNKLEQAGEISYGFFVSKESVMSCYVRDMEDAHIHFVDGSDGGYTMAAGNLKTKMSRN